MSRRRTLWADYPWLFILNLTLGRSGILAFDILTIIVDVAFFSWYLWDKHTDGKRPRRTEHYRGDLTKL